MSYPQGDNAYRAHMRTQSASRIYQPGPTSEQRAAMQPKSIYDGAPQYDGLGGYAQPKESPYAWNPQTMTVEAYKRDLIRRRVMDVDGNMGANVGLLTDADVEAVRASLQAIQDAGRQTHEAARPVLDKHQEGFGLQQTGTRGLGRGMSERTLVGQGHVVPGSLAGAPVMSSAEAYARARQHDEQAKANPQRPVIPSGSSGAGWVGVDR
jgi:hypothetical protein